MTKNLKLGQWMPDGTPNAGEAIVAAPVDQYIDTEFVPNVGGENVIPPVLIPVSPTPPINMEPGAMWFDTSIAPGFLKVLNNASQWVPAARSIPAATAKDQLVMSTSAVGFPWAVTTKLDFGRY